jgi:hypothetical protein
MLGWSEPVGANGQPVAFPRGSGCDASQPRVVCAVSPQDDWVSSRCGCVTLHDRTGAAIGGVKPCRTVSGNAGQMYCCPPGCPAPDGSGTGNWRIYPKTPEEIQQELQQGPGATPPAPAGGAGSALLWGAAGVLALAAVGGGVWWFRSRQRRADHARAVELLESSGSR